MRGIAVVSMVCLLFTGSASALAPKNVVSFQPLGLALGLANIEYERAIAPKASLAVRADVMYLRGDIETDEGTDSGKFTGFGGGGSLRFYPLGSSPKRAYAGFDLDAIHVSGENEDTDETGSATLFTIGAVVGWKWLVADAFAIGLDFGTIYFAGTLDVGEEDAGLAGLRPMSHLYIGMAF